MALLGTLEAAPCEAVIHRLRRYAEMVEEKTQHVNLIASSTVPTLWERHVEDSAQLFPLIPKNAQTLVDIGSGAGFPGLVLAILGVPEVHLVESIGKKARFLQEVVDTLELENVTVHNTRIEALKGLKADIITARAVTALPKLLSLSAALWKKETCGLFLKGQKVDAELTEAKKYWTFKVTKESSLTDPSGAILKIHALKVLRKYDHKHAK
jgi:16S rRNA (guanine527-N7)-methyltransferase